MTEQLGDARLAHSASQASIVTSVHLPHRAALLDAVWRAAEARRICAVLPRGHTHQGKRLHSPPCAGLHACAPAWQSGDLPACLPAGPPACGDCPPLACLPACLPARLPACLPARSLPACLPACLQRWEYFLSVLCPPTRLQDGRMHSFKKGAFSVAAKAKVCGWGKRGWQQQQQQHLQRGGGGSSSSLLLCLRPPPQRGGGGSSSSLLLCLRPPPPPPPPPSFMLIHPAAPLPGPLSTSRVLLSFLVPQVDQWCPSPWWALEPQPPLLLLPSPRLAASLPLLPPLPWQVPVVPITLVGTGDLMPNAKEYLLYPGKVQVRLPAAQFVSSRTPPPPHTHTHTLRRLPQLPSSYPPSDACPPFPLRPLLLRS